MEEEVRRLYREHNYDKIYRIVSGEENVCEKRMGMIREELLIFMWRMISGDGEGKREVKVIDYYIIVCIYCYLSEKMNEVELRLFEDYRFDSRLYFVLDNISSDVSYHDLLLIVLAKNILLTTDLNSIIESTMKPICKNIDILLSGKDRDTYAYLVSHIQTNITHQLKLVDICVRDVNDDGDYNNLMDILKHSKGLIMRHKYYINVLNGLNEWNDETTVFVMEMIRLNNSLLNKYTKRALMNFPKGNNMSKIFNKRKTIYIIIYKLIMIYKEMKIDPFDSAKEYFYILPENYNSQLFKYIMCIYHYNGITFNTYLTRIAEVDISYHKSFFVHALKNYDLISKDRIDVRKCIEEGDITSLMYFIENHEDYRTLFSKDNLIKLAYDNNSYYIILYLLGLGKLDYLPLKKKNKIISRIEKDIKVNPYDVLKYGLYTYHHIMYNPVYSQLVYDTKLILFKFYLSSIGLIYINP